MFVKTLLSIMFILSLTSCNSSSSDTNSISKNSNPNPPTDLSLNQELERVVFSRLKELKCSSAEFEFPLATHWSAVIGWSEGSSDDLTVQAPNAPLDSRFYNFQFLPEYEKYIGTKYSIKKWADDDAKIWAQSLCNESFIPVEFRRPISYSNWAESKKAAVGQRASIQILSGLLGPRSMATLFLPPGWNPQAPRGSYPVLFEGAYDVNDTNLNSSTTIARVMASLAKENISVISVVWNAGGSIASRTMDDASLIEFNQILQRVADHFGGDPNRVMTYGSSRGGIASLRMASNPLKLPYTVLAAYAGTPAGTAGTIASLSGATIPVLISAAEWSLGLNKTWTANWTYPTFDFGRNSLTGLTRNQAHLKVLTGTSDIDVANLSRASPASPLMVAALKAAGTRVFLEISSHDFMVPWIDQFRLAKTYIEAGIPLELRINYLAGHWVADATNLIRKTLSAIATKSPLENVIIKGKKNYYRMSGTSEAIDTLTEAKFTYEAPRYMSPGVGGQVIMTGLPGTRVQTDGMTLGAAYQRTDTLGDDGTFILDLAPLPIGQHSVTSIKILKPGQTQWQSISLTRATTKWNPGVLVLDKLPDDPPSMSGEAVTSAILDGYLGSNRELASRKENKNVSYGVSE